MKTFYFNIQSKGGAGKSMLTYLQALKHQADSRTYFIDFDSSAKSSDQQLQFLQGQTPPRFATMSLLEESQEKIDRQLLFENLLELSQKDYDSFYLDFGAPESDQFPVLFSKDYTIEEFKQVADELNAQFIFNIVIAGGTAYLPCTMYLQKITGLVTNVFEVDMYINQGTFSGDLQLIKQLKTFANLPSSHIHAVKEFGDFDITTSPHKSIFQKINEGRGMEAYEFVQKIKIKKELSKI